MKKLSLLFAVAILFTMSFFSFSRVALTQGDETHLSYKLSDDKTYYSVAGIGTVESQKIVVPESYKGLPVKEIEAEAFKNEKYITSVSIGNGVEKIGDKAFAYCPKLESVVLPETLTELGERAFYFDDALLSVDLPDLIEEIRCCTFAMCGSLQEVRFPSSLKSIGDDAFMCCGALQELDFSDTSLKSIGRYTFFDTLSLTTVYLPKTLETVTAKGFLEDSSIQDVYYQGSESDFSKIFIDVYNTALTNATLHFNYTK